MRVFRCCIATVIPVLLLFNATAAEATPFKLIVPTAVTFNTAFGGGISGGTYNGWLGATTEVIDLPRPPGPGASNSKKALGTVTADVAGITGMLQVLVWPVGSALHPLEITSIAGRPETAQFSALIKPEETAVSYFDVGYDYHLQLVWPHQRYEGSANLSYVFAIGKDVAQYSVAVTFINDQSLALPLITVEGAQIVNSAGPAPVPEAGVTATYFVVALLVVASWRARSGAI